MTLSKVILASSISIQEEDVQCKEIITKKRKNKLLWRRIISLFVLHAASVASIVYFILNGVHLLTFIWGVIVATIGGLGVTAGAHRLWTHRSYKAKPQLEILLLLFFSIAGQNTVYQWVLDHRVHHKYSDTDADPHNSKRGFFFSHCGWLMMKKGPEVIEKGKQIDMSDIKNNPYITWHNKYFFPLQVLLCFVMPVLVPIYFWNENLLVSFFALDVVRYTFALNSTWSVNSIAHIWGTKPYDKRICPVDNLPVAVFTLGEGWHNYHHVFPWDYKTGEYGHYKSNVSTMFIDLMAKIGWAYDLKQPSKELIKNIIAKHGDLKGVPEQTESNYKSNGCHN
ncbi:acyl-CoA Delta-9 desaturase-like isoform X2 [Rhodnius prolixus]